MRQFIALHFSASGDEILVKRRAIISLRPDDNGTFVLFNGKSTEIHVSEHFEYIEDNLDPGMAE